MAKFEDLIKRREQLIADAEAQATTRLRGIEVDAWNFVADVILGLDTKAGKLEFSARNIQKVHNGTVSFQRTLKAKLLDFGRWVAGRFLSLFGVNTSYFKIAAPGADKDVYANAKKIVMLRWGFDVEKDKIVELGFLDMAFNPSNIAEDVGRRMLSGVSGGMDLKTFTKTFKDEMLTNNAGNGTLVKEFERAAHDAFQIFDRTTQNNLGTTLELGFALYSGTIMSETRDFCEKRAGKIYSRKVIDGWNDDSWDGKMKDVDVKEACGGYNCRHHLSWLSEQMVELLKKRGTKVDVLG